MTDSGSPFVQALQAAVAGEHAAVWACGRSAGELSGVRRVRAQRELDAHRQARDDLRRQVTAVGSQPVEAAAAYMEPFPVTGARDAGRLMAQVNSALAATYADLAAASEPAARREPAAKSSRAAEHAVQWGADPQAFPGSQAEIPPARRGQAADHSDRPTPSRASATSRDSAR